MGVPPNHLWHCKWSGDTTNGVLGSAVSGPIKRGTSESLHFVRAIIYCMKEPEYMVLKWNAVFSSVYTYMGGEIHAWAREN